MAVFLENCQQMFVWVFSRTFDNTESMKHEYNRFAHIHCYLEESSYWNSSVHVIRGVFIGQQDYANQQVYTNGQEFWQALYSFAL